MKKIWFRRKRYGWGWYPSSWEGWLILAAFVVLIVWNFLRIDAHSHSNSDTLRPFIIQTLLMFIVLTGICYLTGEKPRWQWGDEEKK
jgi:hypothetical protein